ncbi:cache domain-containing protein [Fodinicurvata sp. EGI_FJ10296]|uniref:cache domain-containing protein n=1 Tax=Fodinicurvata sp. EGI_FJ10296 TaxID=3231908 RepID=UPI003455FB65
MFSTTRFATMSLAAVLAFGIGAPASAGTDFGSHEDVMEILPDLVAFTQENGSDAAIAAMDDPDHRFGATSVGLMIWVDGSMGMHNKYPDLAGIDFSQLQDLRGNYVIEEFTAAAEAGGEYSLNYWPHYDDETEYEYHCYSTWVEEPDILATGCR